MALKTYKGTVVSEQTNRSVPRETQMMKYNISFVLTVDEDNNILSSYEEDHVVDIQDLINGIIYDVDDVSIENLTVKEKT